MPREIVTIPLNDPVLTVQVVALYKGKDAGPFAYLQSMRSGVLKTLNTNAEDTETARTYHRREGGYQQMLADALPTDADAVISPPSRMAWQAEPYRQAIRRKNPSAVDLTPRLTRVGNAFAGGRATVAEVTAQLRAKHGAMPVDPEAANLTGISKMHLSAEIDAELAETKSLELSRRYMDADAYFLLKSFSYYPRGFARTQFDLDVAASDPGRLPFRVVHTQIAA